MTDVSANLLDHGQKYIQTLGMQQAFGAAEAEWSAWTTFAEAQRCPSPGASTLKWARSFAFSSTIHRRSLGPTLSAPRPPRGLRSLRGALGLAAISIAKASRTAF